MIKTYLEVIKELKNKETSKDLLFVSKALGILLLSVAFTYLVQGLATGVQALAEVIKMFL